MRLSVVVKVGVLAAFIIGFGLMANASEKVIRIGDDKKTETKPETKPEAKPEVKPEAKTETKAEAKPEKKPDTKAEAKPEKKVEALTDLERLSRDEKIKQERDQYLTEFYTRKGKECFKELDYDNAKVNLDKALEYNPNNQEAREFLSKTETILGLREGRFHRIIDQVKSQMIVERELAMHEVKVGYDDAIGKKNTGDYAGSLDKFEHVRDLIAWVSPYFDTEPYKSLTDTNLQDTAKLKAVKEEREKELQRQKAEEAARMREVQNKEKHEQRIALLLAKGRELLAEARYEEAQSLAESVMKLDPMNGEAKALRDIAFKSGLSTDERKNAKSGKEQTLLSWEETRFSQIPWIEMLIYPDNWAEIMKREVTAIGAEEEEEPVWMPELKAKLDQKVSFDFVETPLADVVTFLTTITNATIILDNKSLENLQHNEVTLRVNDMKLSTALEWILKLVNLEYALKEGAIYIGTADAVGGDAQLRLYDVTDVTLEIRDFPGDLQKLRDRVGTTTGTGSGVSTGVGDDWDYAAAGDGGDDKIFSGDALVKFIMETIAPGTWVQGEGGL